MKMKNKSSVISGLLKFLRPSLPQILMSLLLSAVSVLLTLYFPILIGEAIDCVVSKGNVDFDTLISVLTKAGIVVLITVPIQWIISTLNNSIAFKTVQNMRNAAFSRLQIMPLSFIDSHPSGDIVSRIIADVDTVSDGLLLGFSQLFTGIVTIIATIFFMLSLSPIIAVAVIIITPLSLFVARFISTRTHSLFALQAKTRGEQTALIDEAIGNQKLIGAFLRENDMIERFNEINGRLNDCSLKAIFFSSLVNPSTRFVNSVVYAAVGCFGALAVLGVGGAVMTVGGLSSFLSYANQYTKPFNEISGVITELQNALTCAERVIELVNIETEIPDNKNAVALQSIKGDIELRNVSFSYNPERPLITSFNLSVKSGQRVALVGPTGCGKTTVINLLMRFYDIDSGAILIDGIDIRSITRKSLRESYGMVLQETWIKSGSIKENIAMANPSASDEEIVAAAKEAHAHSFIKRLPDGYNTIIGEDGGGLSQGQKQLLCIARIMLSKPKILILDEATSSIDTRTEMRIQKAFATIMKNKTSFIVAHRLSTIKEADIILVMKDGNIIETGRHEELLERNGFYAELYNSQFEK